VSAARDLPSINRSRLFILPSVVSLRQLRVPCWRRDMSNRFSALASYAGDASRPFSSPFAQSILEPYIRTHGGSTVASCGHVRSLAWWCARARPSTSIGDGHLWCGLDTLIYNDMWGKLCKLFSAPRVTFDDHDHLNIRDRSRGRQSLACGSRAKRIGRGPIPRRRLKCGIASSP
jgi:hypothetical protein